MYKGNNLTAKDKNHFIKIQTGGKLCTGFF